MYHWPNGDCYIGEYRWGVKEGQGRLFSANGDWYEGDWAGGSQTGHGLFNHFALGDRYQGYFLNGKRHGWGSYCWAAGDR